MARYKFYIVLYCIVNLTASQAPGREQKALMTMPDVPVQATDHEPQNVIRALMCMSPQVCATTIHTMWAVYATIFDWVVLVSFLYRALYCRSMYFSLTV